MAELPVGMMFLEESADDYMCGRGTLTILETGRPSALSQSENGLTLPEGLMLMKMMYKMVKR
jgi:hypothetical protein